MMSWKYYDFYFGNANWPSGYLWRVDGDVRQLLIEWPIVTFSVEDARSVVQGWEADSGLVALDAQYYEEADGRVLVIWWAQLTAEGEKSSWEFSEKAGMGAPSVTDEYPYNNRQWTAL